MKKIVKSPDYNYIFDDVTGFFARWGATPNDDPDFSKFGPEIADIEITTKCTGPGGRLCKFCYKSNTPKGENMSFETFKEIFHKLPKNLTQIAFGADADATQNPDMWKMFDYCRNNDHNKVVPNITVADVKELTAARLASVCGAVAVSRYDNKDLCYDSVERLAGAGLEQVNIHQMLSTETYQNALDTVDDYVTDPRLKGIRAIVFLSLKQKGRGTKFNQLTTEQFKAIVDKAFAKNVPIGFDSCSANKFIRSIKDRKNFDRLSMNTEPCESTCFSLYIDVHGKYFPCSFTPGCNGWDEGIDMIESEDFMKDVWYGDKTKHFRETLLGNLDENGVRSCPLYKI